MAFGDSIAEPAPEPVAVAVAEPSPPIALPATLTGASSDTPAWLPEPMPKLSEVLPAAAAPPAVPLAPPWLVAEALPSRPMALPVTEIGAWMGACTWLPPRTPKLSAVLAALAAAPPMSRKPAERIPTLSDLRTQVFIVGYLPFENLLSVDYEWARWFVTRTTCRRAPVGK